MTRHERFDWDDEKAERNRAKHGVTFADAAIVLSDPFADLFHHEEFDEPHSNEAEDRWITTGSHPLGRDIVLRIVWTTRFDLDGHITRIISARRVTQAERLRYEREIGR